MKFQSFLVSFLCISLISVAVPEVMKPYMIIRYTTKEGVEKEAEITFTIYQDASLEKTRDNFLSLLKGSDPSNKKLPYSYENTKFHRIIKDFCIQGGDVVNGDGTGSYSIYGGRFEDEDFKYKHNAVGRLSMANAGKDTNGSQFFISMGLSTHLDGKHVVFGEVDKESLPIIMEINDVETDEMDKPLRDVKVIKCGVKTDDQNKSEL